MEHESPTFSPLYRQTKSLMMQALASGEWHPGQAIPSEQELAHRFLVSQGTVRKAIDEMVAENLLLRRQGKGTFVSSHADPCSINRFMRLASAARVIVPPEGEALDCQHARAGQDAARELSIEPGSPVIIVRRVLRLEGRPVAVDDITLPGDLFPGLNLDVLRGWQGSIYCLFESRFDLTMLHAREKIRAVLADSAVAETLGIDEGSPLLSVERVAFTYGERPVELRRGLYLTTDYHYQNELN